MDVTAISVGVGAGTGAHPGILVAVEGLPHHQPVPPVPLGSAKLGWSQTGLCRAYICLERKK